MVKTLKRTVQFISNFFARKCKCGLTLESDLNASALIIATQTNLLLKNLLQNNQAKSDIQDRLILELAIATNHIAVYEHTTDEIHIIDKATIN